MPSSGAHPFPGEEVMAMTDDVDVSVCRVRIDSTPDRSERMGR
jgi:hypothetical protein